MSGSRPARAGRTVADLACGEGYGSNVLAERATDVIGVDANPEAHEHARRRYQRPNLRFERDLVESFDEPARRHRLPADDRARRATRRAAARLRRDGVRSPTSRRRTASPSPRRAPRSPTTPGTCASTRSPSTASCSSPAFAGSRSSASSTPASCVPTSSRSAPAGTASTRPCASPSRSTTASSPRDLPASTRTSRSARTEEEGLSSRALATSSRCFSGGWCGFGGPRRATRCGGTKPVTGPAGMPMVLGVRDRRRPRDRPPQPHALRRGLRHLSVRRGVALRRGDPLLSAGARGRPRPDDDGDAGAGRPARGPRGAASGWSSSVGSTGSDRRRPTSSRCPTECRAAVAAELERYREALAALEGCGGDVLSLFRGRGGGRPGGADGVRGDPRGAAPPRHRRRRPAAGRRRHRLAPAALRLERGVLAARVRLRPGPRGRPRRARRRVVLRRSVAPTSPPRRRSAPIATGRGRPPSRSTGRRSPGSGRSTAIPRIRTSRSSRASRCVGCGCGGSAAAPMTPRLGGRRRVAAADAFLAAVRDRLAAHAEREGAARPAGLRDRHRADRPLVERGRDLAGGRSRRRGGGGDLARHAGRGPRVPSRRDRGRSRRRPGARQRTSAPGTRRPCATWPGPRAASSCGCCARCARGSASAAAERAARELLAVQASDWAFLDSRGQAGDYPFTRATDHAEALLEALDSPRQEAPAPARTRTRSEPRAPAPDVVIWRRAQRCRTPQQRDPGADPLLGVPAADRGRAGAACAQARRRARRARASRSTCSRAGARSRPPRRSVRASASTGSSSRSGRPTSASSSPGSSG